MIKKKSAINSGTTLSARRKYIIGHQYASGDYQLCSQEQNFLQQNKKILNIAIQKLIKAS